jgi:phosphoenolpyruvate synthase/pyruvate phosphate dikinase
VLTEQGGVTSHAAIICRELGVPTIIGIEGLLDRVRDGDWLEIDAEHGTVVVKRSTERAVEPTANHSREKIGAKAFNLGLVRSMGYRVPDFVVLEFDRVRRIASAPQSRANRQQVQRVLDDLRVYNGDKLAVRSSCASEDHEEGSNAGQYRSLLDVGRLELPSALGEFVRTNRGDRSRRAYRGSVIVQRMVRPDCSGVCLTRDARTGNRDAVIIEMVAGANAAVTGGTVRPDRFVVDRLTGDILEEDRRCAELRNRAIDVTGLVRQFLTLEARFGRPLDVEWALVDRELYILQARPIVGNLDPSAARVGPAVEV